MRGRVVGIDDHQRIVHAVDDDAKRRFPRQRPIARGVGQIDLPDVPFRHGVGRVVRHEAERAVRGDGERAVGQLDRQGRPIRRHGRAVEARDGERLALGVHVVDQHIAVLLGILVVACLLARHGRRVVHAAHLHHDLRRVLPPGRIGDRVGEAGQADLAVRQIVEGVAGIEAERPIGREAAGAARRSLDRECVPAIHRDHLKWIAVRIGIVEQHVRCHDPFVRDHGVAIVGRHGWVRALRYGKEGQPGLGGRTVRVRDRVVDMGNGSGVVGRRREAPGTVAREHEVPHSRNEDARSARMDGRVVADGEADHAKGSAVRVVVVDQHVPFRDRVLDDRHGTVIHRDRGIVDQLRRDAGDARGRVRPPVGHGEGKAARAVRRVARPVVERELAQRIAVVCDARGAGDRHRQLPVRRARPPCQRTDRSRGAVRSGLAADQQDVPLRRVHRHDARPAQRRVIEVRDQDVGTQGHGTIALHPRSLVVAAARGLVRPIEVQVGNVVHLADRDRRHRGVRSGAVLVDQLHGDAAPALVHPLGRVGVRLERDRAQRPLPILRRDGTVRVERDRQLAVGGQGRSVHGCGGEVGCERGRVDVQRIADPSVPQHDDRFDHVLIDVGDLDVFADDGGRLPVLDEQRRMAEALLACAIQVDKGGEVQGHGGRGGLGAVLAVPNAQHQRPVVRDRAFARVAEPDRRQRYLVVLRRRRSRKDDADRPVHVRVDRSDDAGGQRADDELVRRTGIRQEHRRALDQPALPRRDRDRGGNHAHRGATGPVVYLVRAGPVRSGRIENHVGRGGHRTIGRTLEAGRVAKIVDEVVAPLRIVVAVGDLERGGVGQPKRDRVRGSAVPGGSREGDRRPVIHDGDVRVLLQDVAAQCLARDREAFRMHEGQVRNRQQDALGDRIAVGLGQRPRDGRFARAHVQRRAARSARVEADGNVRLHDLAVQNDVGTGCRCEREGRPAARRRLHLRIVRHDVLGAIGLEHHTRRVAPFAALLDQHEREGDRGFHAVGLRVGVLHGLDQRIEIRRIEHRVRRIAAGDREELPFGRILDLEDGRADQNVDPLRLRQREVGVRDAHDGELGIEGVEHLDAQLGQPPFASGVDIDGRSDRDEAPILGVGRRDIVAPRPLALDLEIGVVDQGSSVERCIPFRDRAGERFAQDDRRAVLREVGVTFLPVDADEVRRSERANDQALGIFGRLKEVIARVVGHAALPDGEVHGARIATDRPNVQRCAEGCDRAIGGLEGQGARVEQRRDPVLARLAVEGVAVAAVVSAAQVVCGEEVAVGVVLTDLPGRARTVLDVVRDRFQHRTQRRLLDGQGGAGTRLERRLRGQQAIGEPDLRAVHHAVRAVERGPVPHAERDLRRPAGLLVRDEAHPGVAGDRGRAVRGVGLVGRSEDRPLRCAVLQNLPRAERHVRRHDGDAELDLLGIDDRGARQESGDRASGARIAIGLRRRGDERIDRLVLHHGRVVEARQGDRGVRGVLDAGGVGQQERHDPLLAQRVLARVGILRVAEQCGQVVRGDRAAIRVRDQEGVRDLVERQHELARPDGDDGGLLLRLVQGKRQATDPDGLARIVARTVHGDRQGRDRLVALLDREAVHREGDRFAIVLDDLRGMVVALRRTVQVDDAAGQIDIEEQPRLQRRGCILPADDLTSARPHNRSFRCVLRTDRTVSVVGLRTDKTYGCFIRAWATRRDCARVAVQPSRGSSVRSRWSRRCSWRSGMRRPLPNRAASSSLVKPGVSVAISNRIPPGVRK